MLKAGDNEGSTIKMASDTHAFHVYCMKTRERTYANHEKGAQHDKNTKCNLARKGHQICQNKCQNWHVGTEALWQPDEHKEKCVRHSRATRALREDASLFTQ